MSKKLIWAVTVMMGLAMAAFIILQAYWIKAAAGIKTEQFDQLVIRSMIDIAHQIEYRETQRIVSGGTGIIRYGNMRGLRPGDRAADEALQSMPDSNSLQDGIQSFPDESTEPRTARCSSRRV
jgi:hypothetical protein